MRAQRAVEKRTPPTVTADERVTTAVEGGGFLRGQVSAVQAHILGESRCKKESAG